MRIKKRSGETLLLVLTCFPPDGAPSFVLRLFFLSSNTYPYQTLCICLYPPCILGCIALGVCLWPALLSQLWPAAVLCLGSVWFFKAFCIMKLWYCWVQSHCVSTALCFVTTIHIHLCGTVWDKQTKKWVQFRTPAWVLEAMMYQSSVGLWPVMECVSSLEITDWFLQTRAVSV